MEATHYNEEKMDRLYAKRAKQRAYDAVYEAHRNLEKLMDEWGSSHNSELKERIQECVTFLAAAMEEL